MGDWDTDRFCHCHIAGNLPSKKVMDCKSLMDSKGQLSKECVSALLIKLSPTRTPVTVSLNFISFLPIGDEL